VQLPPEPENKPITSAAEARAQAARKKERCRPSYVEAHPMPSSEGSQASAKIRDYTRRVPVISGVRREWKAAVGNRVRYRPEAQRLQMPHNDRKWRGATGAAEWWVRAEASVDRSWDQAATRDAWM
jgi:hypothetical protein